MWKSNPEEPACSRFKSIENKPEQPEVDIPSTDLDLVQEHPLDHPSLMGIPSRSCVTSLGPRKKEKWFCNKVK